MTRSKRMLAVLLSLLMIATVFPVTAFSAEKINEDMEPVFYLEDGGGYHEPVSEIPIGTGFAISVYVGLYKDGVWEGPWGFPNALLLVMEDGTKSYDLYRDGLVKLGGHMDDAELEGPGWMTGFSSNSFLPGTYHIVLETDTHIVTSNETVEFTGTPMASPPTVTTGSLKDTCMGASYSAQVKATAGNGGALTWSVLSGKLPDGLKLNAKTGKISGKATKKGTFDFVIQVSEAGGETAEGSYTITVRDHAWDKGKVTKKASCEEDGEKTFTCANCGETKTEPITATGHDWGAWTKLNDKQHQRVCANDSSHVETAAHTWDKGKVTKNATCEKDGVKTYTCTVCKATKTEKIAATDHAWGEWTKLDEKQHRRVCSNDPTHVETAAHTWDKGKVTKKATCEKDGEKTYTCTACGATKTESIGKTEHTPKTVPGKEPTCTEIGYGDGVVCAVCGAVIETQEPIPALGHAYGEWKKLDDETHERVCANDPSHVETAAHIWDNGKVTKKATCSAEGEKTYTCTVCGALKSESIAKTAHTEKVVPGKDPTCTEAGCGEGVVCGVCGEILRTQEPIPPTGHAYGAWEKVDDETHKRVCANDPSHVETAAHTWDKGKVTKKATCSENGEKTYTCTVCGATKAESIEKTAHTPKTVPGKDPTCTEAGLTEGTVCAVCGAILEAQEPIPPTGQHQFGPWMIEAQNHHRECELCGEVEQGSHSWDKGIIEKEATCTEEGRMTFTCTICGGTKGEFIEKTAHTEKTVSGKEPTCTEAGLTDGIVCAVCGEVITAQKKIPAPGHIDENGDQKCDRCGFPLPRAIKFDPPLPYTSNGLTIRVFIPAGDGGVYIEVANESGSPVNDETVIPLTCYDDNGEKIVDAGIKLAADLSDGEFTIIYTEIKAGDQSIDQPAKVTFAEIVPEKGYDYDESSTEEKDGVTVQKDYVCEGVSASVDIETGKDGEKSAVITVSPGKDGDIKGDCALEYKICGEDGLVIESAAVPKFNFDGGSVKIPVELPENATKILVGKIEVPEQTPAGTVFEPALPYTSNGLTIRGFTVAEDGSAQIEVVNESGKPVKDTTQISLACYDEKGEKVVDVTASLNADLSDKEFTVITTEIKAGGSPVVDPAKVSFGEIRPDAGYDYEDGKTEKKNGVSVQKDYAYDGISASVDVKQEQGGEKTAVITLENTRDTLVKGECTVEYKICGDDGRVIDTVIAPAFNFDNGPVEIPVKLPEGATKILVGKIDVPEQHLPVIAFEPALPYTSNGLTIRQFIPAGDGSVYIEVANESGKPVKDTTQIRLTCYDEKGEKIVDAEVPLSADLSDKEFTIISAVIKAGEQTVDTPAKVSFGEIAPAAGYDYDESNTEVKNGVTVQKDFASEGLAAEVEIRTDGDGSKIAVIRVTNQSGAPIDGECAFEYKLCGTDGRVIETFDSPTFTFDGDKPFELPVKLIEDASKILIGSVTVPKKPAGQTFTLGDVNGDGKINSSDARLALRAAAKIEKLTALQEKLADVSGDGKVKSGDARTILRIAAKLEPKPETQIAAE